MKVTAKQYARSLYEVAQNKKGSQAKDAIKRFTVLLVNNNDIAKADKIIMEFEQLWNKEQGIVAAEIVSARELDKKIVKMLNDYIVKLSQAEKVEVTEKVDRNILGGTVIKFGDKIIDGSTKARLDELKREMIK